MLTLCSSARKYIEREHSLVYLSNMIRARDIATPLDSMLCYGAVDKCFLWFVKFSVIKIKSEIFVLARRTQCFCRRLSPIWFVRFKGISCFLFRTLSYSWMRASIVFDFVLMSRMSKKWSHVISELKIKVDLRFFFTVHEFPFGCFSTFPIWPYCHVIH